MAIPTLNLNNLVLMAKAAALEDMSVDLGQDPPSLADGVQILSAPANEEHSRLSWPEALHQDVHVLPHLRAGEEDPVKQLEHRP